ncbi:MAG TPA: copper homeostasis protein CutC [Cyclobacteriaceae bacterium]|nr:copper homeostasis protein CutC [Cyclobacteriaceae bacterium]
MYIREACVETIIEAVHAQERGADRIELCSELGVGGLTPSYALIESAKRILKIPIMVMVRPRPGDFNYSDGELKIMRQAIDVCKSIGVYGIVTGCLTKNNQVDAESTAALASYALPLQVTFHKAIDKTPDIFGAAEQLTAIPGITRVLTSGGADTAIEGADTINKLMEATSGSMIIIAAGKITDQNFAEVTTIIKAKEYHGRKIVGAL